MTEVKTKAGSSVPVRSATGYFVLAGLVAGIVGAAIGYSLYSESLSALGIPDPGFSVSFGLPFVRGLATMFGFIGVGSFLMSAFGTPPRKDGFFDVDGYKASRTGTWCLFIWAVLALLLIPMSLSDVSGAPLSTTLSPAHWGEAIDQVSVARSWMWVAIFALITVVWSLGTRRWIFQMLFFAFSLVTLIPISLEGHSAAGGNHDYGVNSYLWHFVFCALWVGGLAAMIQHALRKGPHMDVIVKRYSFLALVSIIVLAISGVVNALLRIRVDELLTSNYGRVITAKAVLLIVLGIFGFLHRRMTIPKLEKDPSDRLAFSQIAIVELIVMAATIGVAVSLSRIPPPLPKELNLNVMELELGFSLTKPPSWGGLFGMVRFDMIYGTVAIIAEVLYVWAYVHLRKKGGEWPFSRVLWWTLGNILLLFATSSGLGMYAMVSFSMHMIQHMILSMAIPIAWVLAGPVTLFLRALPVAGRDGVPGPREWIVAFINNPVSRFLTNPVVAAAQFVIGFYIMYFTPLFEALMKYHFGHLFMIAHFLVSGYIFYWISIGIDAAPRHTSPFIKMVTILGTMPFHAWFAIALMQLNYPLGQPMYETFGIPWHIDYMADQNLGGKIAWATGEIPLLIVTAAHFLQWRREDSKETARYERRADRTHEAELNAYNEMLAALHSGAGDRELQDYYGSDYSSDEVRSYFHQKKFEHHNVPKKRRSSAKTSADKPTGSVDTEQQEGTGDRSGNGRSGEGD
ncbi:bifunctional copper resistance protein CopD/cytochrome c oxidase assembly protein [Corynebacterium sp. MC-21]|uniref:bifunctional copper resistance protein CopD/cytochrome c oxidase assembly protein n=1 Tax=Corynebacterium parakroppenstedtii TaxID=2828363 RepID=UPI001EF0646B|nr:cytochrome c oxidase assembly protein [Corynebacterium parakroppenstedtii]MCF6778545.1 bifunctional copper resistance protein CopD/cytochrome c oxidase assembly protein [Corynebacterium parakroppenstedtii]MCF6788456.1 bifunctional copper resistance protein CopD/cytochrome c oxidase assembly protein [Corynebacterium parakroppenstedtii]MDU3197334.1 cytochrome c oxidase assembly protein [Corynebacterium kroppenstedtii]